MKLLLDTHTFLWLVEGSPKLSATAAAAIADPVNELFLSVASVWELAIKTGNKKLKLSDPPDVYVARCTPVYQIDLLPIHSSHALARQEFLESGIDPSDPSNSGRDRFSHPVHSVTRSTRSETV